MSLKSTIRNWIFPSKEDSFDTSYDYLLEFFKTLDEEFGGLTDFLFDYRIEKFFRTEVEITNTAGTEGQYGMYIKNGDILHYKEGVWEVVDRVGRLPKIKQRDPNKEDIATYDEGETWINSRSGQVFRLLGTLLVDDNNGIYEAMWANQDGIIQHETKFVKKFLFYPNVNFSYKTKTLHSYQGEQTFDDDLLHMEGVIGSDGQAQYFDHDTHMDLYIQEKLVGTLIINREKIQTLMDLTFFNPEGGLPDHNDVAINDWYDKFERLLSILEISSVTNQNLEKTLKTDMIFNYEIEEILTDQNTYVAFFDENGFLMIPELDVLDMKEKYRSFFASLHFQEMSILRKQFAIYLIGQCVAMESFDGNIYYIDGSTMVADGNSEPIC